MNPVINLAKGISLKTVLDARYLNSTAEMNSAYNKMPLDEQSRRLTQFVIGNQQ